MQTLHDAGGVPAQSSLGRAMVAVGLCSPKPYKGLSLAYCVQGAILRVHDRSRGRSSRFLVERCMHGRFGKTDPAGRDKFRSSSREPVST